MLLNLLLRNLETIFMIPLFSFKLWSRRSFKDAETKFFWITVISCLILAAEDILEGIASMDPSLRFWRILLSAIGYIFRSAAAVGLLLVVVPPEKRQFRLWIPNLLLIPICLSAFFTDIAFGFDENYVFYRGPLNYVAFAVPIIYLLLICGNGRLIVLNLKIRGINLLLIIINGICKKRISGLYFITLGYKNLAYGFAGLDLYLLSGLGFDNTEIFTAVT